MTGQNKHILIFGGVIHGVGGLQRSYQMLTGYLIKKGHRLTFYAWRPSKEKEALGSVVDPQVKVRYINPSHDKNNRLKIQKLVHEDQPDVVLLVNSSVMRLSWMLAIRKLGIPIVGSERGHPDFCLKYGWASKRLRDLGFYLSDFHHLLMPSYINSVPSHLRSKVTIIPSQIEPAESIAEPVRPGKNGRFIVMYSGRLTYEKRVDLLIRSFAICAPSFPIWDLHIYGDGEDLEDIRLLSESLGIINRISFLKANDTMEMYNRYSEANLLVLPSEYEGCPMALREGMAHGLPVIGYKECGGTNEIITDGKDGFLVENDDRVFRLAQAMQTLMKDGDLRTKMGASAMETSRLYHPDIVHAAWESLLLRAAVSRNIWSQLRRMGKVLRMPFKSYFARRDYSAICKLNDFRYTCIIDRRFRSWWVIIFTCFRVYIFLWGKKLFDPRFYLQEYLDVKKQGTDPLLHYVTKGWKEGKNPSAFFDNNAYIKKMMGNKKSICPLYHFYITGIYNNIKYDAPKTRYAELSLNRRDYAFVKKSIQIEGKKI